VKQIKTCPQLVQDRKKWRAGWAGKPRPYAPIAINNQCKGRVSSPIPRTKFLPVFRLKMFHVKQWLYVFLMDFLSRKVYGGSPFTRSSKPRGKFPWPTRPYDKILKKIITRKKRTIRKQETCKTIHLPPPPYFDAHSVNLHFVIILVTSVICSLKLLVVDSLYIFIGFPQKYLASLITIFDVLTVPLGIVSIVFSCMLFYKQWWLLQGFGARTTPGKAVGYSFVPFFCFYWWFVALAGLATDTNNYLHNVKIPGIRMSFGLCVVYCVAGILGWIIGFPLEIFKEVLKTVKNPTRELEFSFSMASCGTLIFNVLGTIIFIILLIQQRNCILAILKDRAEKIQENP
jgi:hypothetical protein